ncbi:hypothetical protein [Nocardia yamanashiensis]|uniref:hypothetical protein n=1 Tax=Nocardia yamanashiensis TaxID=209247 RepID=UPI0022B85281|nr:hypothetical protein [Nocardia yamanashiensis]
MQPWVTICLPPDALADLKTAITQALAPFDRHQGFPRQNMWTTWRTRPAEPGAGFYVRPGHENDPRLIHDAPNQFGITLLPTPRECAGGPKSLLNIPTHNLSHPDILTLDGWWIEPNGTHHHKTNEPNPPPPPADIENYLDSLPDDTILVRVYCHIRASTLQPRHSPVRAVEN